MAAAARLSVCLAVSGKAQRGVPFGAQRRRALAQCVPPGAVLLFALGRPISGYRPLAPPGARQFVSALLAAV